MGSFINYVMKGGGRGLDLMLHQYIRAFWGDREGVKHGLKWCYVIYVTLGDCMFGADVVFSSSVLIIGHSGNVHSG